MMPIIYEPGTLTFDGRGLGRLSDAISVTVTEELNGEFEAIITYPMDGQLFDQVGLSSIIAIEPAPGKAAQAFEVYDISKPLNGIVTIYLQHIVYRTSFIPVTPFSALNLQGALKGLKDNAAESCPFTFWTNKSVESPYSQTTPGSLRARLQGEEGSILQTYKGQYEYDNYTIRLWGQRGQNNGVTIRYGKNLLDMTQEESIRETITGVYPFWTGMDGEETKYMELPEKVLHSSNADNFPFQRTVPLDLSAEWLEEPPTEAQLRTRAERYMSDNNIGVPDVSLEVSFVSLADTEDYKDIAPLEEVNMGDVVRVEYPALGVSNRAQVVKTVYDALLGRYSSINIGEVKANLAKVIVAQGIDTQIVASESSKALAAYNKAMDQKAVFDRLTNNGELQGLYMEDGNLYINASYLKSGVIDADVVKIINLIAQTAVSVSEDGLTQSEIEGGNYILGYRESTDGSFSERIRIKVVKSGSDYEPEILMSTPRIYGDVWRNLILYSRVWDNYNLPPLIYTRLAGNGLYVGTDSDRTYGGEHEYGYIGTGTLGTKVLNFYDTKNGVGHIGVTKVTSEGVMTTQKNVDWITVQGTDGKTHYVLGTT